MTPQEQAATTDHSVTYNAEIEPQYLIKESKFILISVMTFGLYPAWWIYKTWSLFIQKEGSDANAATRLIFNIFFMFSLLNRIKRFAKQEGYPGNFYPLISYILIIGVSLASFIPPPIGIIGLLSFLFYLPALRALNFALEQSAEILTYADEGLTTRQMVLVVTGGILWVLIALGLVMGT